MVDDEASSIDARIIMIMGNHFDRFEMLPFAAAPPPLFFLSPSQIRPSIVIAMCQGSGVQLGVVLDGCKGGRERGKLSRSTDMHVPDDCLHGRSL